MSALQEEALSILSYANCSDHPTGVTKEDVGDALYAQDWCSCAQDGKPMSCGSWCDSYGAAIFEAGDEFIVATEWSDSSGHG